MKIIYIVYREDNTMVFDSQVLEYLRILDRKHEVKLVVFRNYVNLFKKKEVENKISKFLGDYITFSTLPLISKIQLDYAAIRLKVALSSKLNKGEPLLVLCRGELSTYIAHKAFKAINKVILYDNRGLSVEELELRNENGIIYRLNKEIKRKAILYAKDHCDVYSFVTNNLRKYMIDKYKYNEEKKYFILPTLNVKEELDVNKLEEIKQKINYNNKEFYVIYVGSVAAWQNVDRLFNVFLEIKKEISNAKLLILTNGRVNIPETLEGDIEEAIIVKSVRHDLVKYYLQISNLGLVLRNDDIVNRVAAPTKIAEYLSNNVYILYDGEIGVIDDLRNNYGSEGLIKFNDEGWLSRIIEISEQNEKVSLDIMYNDYFDMEKNQNRLISEMKKYGFNIK